MLFFLTRKQTIILVQIGIKCVDMRKVKEVKGVKEFPSQQGHLD